MKVGELFAQWCDTIGFDKTSTELKDIVSITTEVPSGLESKLLSSLMTEAQARNNPALKNHFTKNALDAIDKDILLALEEHGFDDGAKEEIKKITSTYQKLPVLRKKIAELEASKVKSTGDDKEKLVKKISELNNQVLETEKKYQKEIAEYKANEDSRMLEYALRSTLSARQYPNEKMPHDVKVETAYNLLNKAAKEKGARIVFAPDKRGVKLVQADNPDLGYTVNNKEVSFDSFAEQIFVDNGMTIVSNPATNGNGSHSVDISKLPQTDQATARQLMEHISQM